MASAGSTNHSLRRHVDVGLFVLDNGQGAIDVACLSVCRLMVLFSSGQANRTRRQRFRALRSVERANRTGANALLQALKSAASLRATTEIWFATPAGDARSLLIVVFVVGVQVIGRDEAVYFYLPDLAGACFGFEGKKQHLYW